MPAVLDEIIGILRQKAGLTARQPEVAGAGSQVGQARHDQRDDIELVVYGIGSLSDAMGELAGAQNLSFAADEYHAFNQGIDEGTAAAIRTYDDQARSELTFEHSQQVGHLAHELRNALGAAQIAMATLKRGVVGINSRTGDILARSLKHAQQITDQTLAAVRLEVGAPIQRKPINLSDLAHDLQASALPERGVTIRLELEKELVVSSDERLLFSSAGNLLQNALKFTRAGGVVTIRTRSEAGQATIEVEDQCGGLPPGSEQSMIAPFVQQGDDRRGMGLGLSIARTAIEAMGGRLVITNLPGRGCIARLDLPHPESAAR